jgi:hypothetical protein
MLPAGPVWFQLIAVSPFAHFFAGGLSTVSCPFLLTQPRIVLSEPTKLAAANAVPPSKRKIAKSPMCCCRM